MVLFTLSAPLTVVALWVALVLPAYPVGTTEMNGESDQYSASVRLADGILVIAIVNKVSGKEVSNRVETKATRLTGMRFLDNEGQIIVHGQIGSRGDIRFEFFVKDASYIDRIHGLRSESLNYSLSVRLEEAYPPEVEYRQRVLDISVVNKATGERVFRRTPTRMAKLTELYVLQAQQRLIVHGELGSRGDILSVVNLEDASVLDTIYGWQASFSPDQTRVAYNFRYPPHAMSQHGTSVLLIYDFAATPRENSFRDKDMADPTTRGYVIYPERNRKRGKHFIPAMSEAEQTDFLSPIAWSHDGTKVALLEGGRGDAYLLLADLANGLDAPEVTRTPLEKESFYKQPIEIYWTREYQDATVGAKSLRFSRDNKTVLFTIWGHGPFKEQEVVMELDRTSTDRAR